MSGTVLILGVGAAAGVGAAVARKFAGAGYHVMIAGRTLEKLNTTAADISAAGGSIESIVADVTSQEDQQRVFELVRARNEPLSAVIYNAGSNLPIKFSDLSPEQFEDFWRIGCFGAFLTS
ncbi:MAG: SDR family NAD(P)-dependent oxidoreductase, partial [Pseudomonadota bacterium]|nr:SDR family NAD(P)-dependent oxidoreductase [Pseudomonadota bacterium]